jgi:hypothetical protein
VLLDFAEYGQLMLSYEMICRYATCAQMFDVWRKTFSLLFSAP